MPNHLHALDHFFLLLHTAVTIFNVFGWIPPRTRRLHLFSLLLTALSWFVLGFFYGIGYCFCTDWHFQVLEALGERDLPQSYITYIIRRWSGYEADDHLVMQLTGIIFAAVTCLSLALNWRSRQPAKNTQ